MDLSDGLLTGLGGSDRRGEFAVGGGLNTSSPSIVKRVVHDEAKRAAAWPTTWQGTAATSALRTGVQLRQQRDVTVNVDGKMSTVLQAVQTADSDSRARLAQLHAEIAAGMKALAPSMDTPAGRLQMVRFLELKAAEAQQIQMIHRQVAQRFATAVSSLGDDYLTLAGARSTAAPPVDEEGNGQGSPRDREPTVRMASWGQIPLTPPAAPPTEPAPPDPTPGPGLPAPLRDFTEYQMQGREVPPWAPPPPPSTGEPINLGPSAPRAPSVIALEPSTGPVDLFPNCDTRQVLSKTGQIAGIGIGAAVLVTTGPLTAGVTWAGLGAAAISLTDAIDGLAVCKGLP